MLDIKIWDANVNARVLSEQAIEVWLELDDGYGISNLGRFASIKQGKLKVLRGSQAATGYVLYTTFIGGRKTSQTAQQMVLRAFDGPPPSPRHTDARHLNGCKSDNRLHNLAWGTRSENMLDAWDQRRQGLPTSTTNVSPQPNRTFMLDETLVQKGIKLFEKGSISLNDLAELWQCTSGVARRALVGETWSHLERDMAKIEEHLGRIGGKHHLSDLDDVAVIEALELYTKNHWSGPELAQHLGISKATAAQILSGKTWTHLPRPEGFQYPWKDASVMRKNVGSRGNTKLTEELVASVLEKVASGELQTAKEVGEALSLNRGPTWQILKGNAWSHVPRPEGFDAVVDQMRRR